MIKWIETTGRSEEDAIAAALFQLGLDRDDVSVEVIERAKSGFLGFGGNPAKVRVSYEVPDENEKPAPSAAPEKEPEPAVSAPKAEPVPEKKAEPAPKVEKQEAPAAKEDKNRLQPGDEVLIGKEEPSAPKGMDGQPLELASADDIKAQRIREFLAGLMEHLQVEAVPDIYVSENGYKVILQGRGLGAIIGKVVKYRKNMTLEPMNAYERHVIHAALQDYPNVTTYSTGVEPNRRTVVAYAPGQK